MITENEYEQGVNISEGNVEASAEEDPVQGTLQAEDNIQGCQHDVHDGGYMARTITAELRSTLVEGVQNFFKDSTGPLAMTLGEDMEQLQHDVNSLTDVAQSEKAAVEQELTRLSALVLAFQERISKFLHAAQRQL
ncbi:hypothetical protein CEUSTIGMA_g7376.t1 [Chlamydomonas eustigma]|uniref:Uncharacterized protein n=1 Tax=Chlamydomonas eustigma TaxID=1157962 RepID=A0A250XA65_9CHLO|nr:hypothetical protein CEUSTIGMA_g7376.t1 [Chlamydomonas eustigma]|eukprot:GAX79936.1 hypothetical protein CEUSTIGMA_g7376.t1 [Chlamydomonas eustigma]